ncbi:hypothetical protein [Microseira sp. BLCC-F43]|jgi:hypothetical protein|uniref:hypothetical protein n=1 Tax=Microseira sp. BLCC-F43 TaxID=3153602 RepID=UPI0035BB698E
MIRARVLIKQISSPDGNAIAVAKSVAITSGDREGKMSQTVTAKVSSDNRCSSSSTSSSASSL